MVLLPVVGGALGYFYSHNQDRVFEASATLLVQQRRSLSPTPSDFTLSEQLASTYGRLAMARPFLSDVVKENDIGFSVDSLRGMVSSHSANNPPVLIIGIRNSDPVVAANTATIVANEFIDYVIERRLSEIARLQSAAAAQGISNVQDLVSAQFTVVDALSILEPVSIPSEPILPKTQQNVLLGSLIGFIMATGSILLISSLSDTVRNPEELSRRFGTTALGTIFRWSNQDIEESELVVWKYPSSGYAESFRQARANIQFATANKPGKLIMVTSAGPSEGKSTIASNLAVTLSQTGKTVTIVDGDLRRPSVHRRFKQVQRQPGLSNYLSGAEPSITNITYNTEIEGVSVVPGGPVPPNPSELLGSPNMKTALQKLSEISDIVIVDSPPILLVADGSVLAAQVDGVIVIVDGLNTKSTSLRGTLDALRTTNVNIIGVIINKMKRVRFGYGYHYYPYYYYYSGYKYYYASDSDDDQIDNSAAFYKKPFLWIKSITSRKKA